MLGPTREGSDRGRRHRDREDRRDRLSEAPPAVRHQRLHGSHYSFVDPDEARFVTADLIAATCLSGTPPEMVERIKTLEREGLRQIMLYPPLNRQYRVIEDFADKIMARL
jgi:alkanesulfonate monooxygenase SsuD/methylene tetrahydromethanopterin reductase-like flavin-dependent oxidoreductase (luciferase family)